MKKTLFILSLSLLLIGPGTVMAQDEGDDTGTDAGDSLIQTAQSLLGSKMDEKCGECSDNVEACVNKQVKAVKKLFPQKLVKACGLSMSDIMSTLNDDADAFVESCDLGGGDDEGDGEEPGDGSGDVPPSGGDNDGPAPIPPPH